jgi:molybdopterin synthase sulfur carrier subunit
MPLMLPMPTISTTDHSLLALTGGQTHFEVPPGSVRQALQTLEARHPGVLAHVDAGMAIAIDGVIHQDGWLEPIGPDSEVVLIPRISGG